MLVRLEKRWKDCDQPVFLAALILNPFEMMTCFGPNANLNQIKCLNMVVLVCLVSSFFRFYAYGHNSCIVG
jgi:hypothetical protein